MQKNDAIYIITYTTVTSRVWGKLNLPRWSQTPRLTIVLAHILFCGHIINSRPVRSLLDTLAYNKPGDDIFINVKITSAAFTPCRKK